MKRILVPMVLVTLLSGCVSNGAGPKQSMGGLIGAAGGAVAGAQFGKGDGQLLGVAVGTMLGAYAGDQMGRSADRADMLYHQHHAGQNQQSGYIRY